MDVGHALAEIAQHGDVGAGAGTIISTRLKLVAGSSRRGAVGADVEAVGARWWVEGHRRRRWEG